MIIIEATNDSKPFFDSLLNENPEQIVIMEKEDFLEEASSFQIFITLSPILITGVCQVISALINANKEFTFKENGKEVSFKGFSEKKIFSMLSKMSIEESEHSKK
jgi:hypothetical protein